MQDEHRDEMNRCKALINKYLFYMEGAAYDAAEKVRQDIDKIRITIGDAEYIEILNDCRLEGKIDIYKR